MPIEDKQITLKANSLTLTQTAGLLIKKLGDYKHVPLDTYTNSMTNEETIFFNTLRQVPFGNLQLNLCDHAKMTISTDTDHLRFNFLMNKFNDNVGDFIRNNFETNSSINTRLSESLPNIKLKGFINLNFDDIPGNDIYLKNPNMVINNIKHFEVAAENGFLHTMCCLDTVATDQTMAEYIINLNEFARLNIGHENLMDYKFDSECFDILEETVNLMDENNISNVQNHAISISLSFDKTIKINMGGFTLFKSINLKRYKYVRHPGLNMILTYLRTTGYQQRLHLMGQRKAFRTL